MTQRNEDRFAREQFRAARELVRASRDRRVEREITPAYHRLMCPDCKTVVSHADGEESIECPRCERFVMRMFWIKLPEPCNKYAEDQFICDDVGEPKGQCARCGFKWFEHSDEALPEEEKTDMKVLNEIRAYQANKR